MTANYRLKGHGLVSACRRLVTIFSDPGHRTPLEAELALAADFYNERGSPPERTELAGEGRKYEYMGWARNWVTNVREFPFIFTCLMLGVGYNPAEASTRYAELMPLGTVFDDSSIMFGMVVIDISNLDRVSHGIVCFHIYRAIDSAGGDNRTALAEEVRPRIPLSAAQYLHKFGFDGDEEADDAEEVETLGETPVILPSAMALVWPREDENLQTLAKTESRQPSGAIASLRDHAITRLIESTRDVDSFDMSVFDRPRTIPGFQDMLREQLQLHSYRLGHSRSAAQLLGLAFASHQHLNLVRFKELPADVVAYALEYLETVTSVSIFLHSDFGPVDRLLDVIAHSETIHDVCFVQSPTRSDDTLTTQLFLELSKRPQLFRKRITCTGAYSAALRRTWWFPPSNCQPLDYFPVHQMFFHQRYNNRMYCYLSDGLLRPERFAAGFLQWLRRPGDDLFSFASAAPGLVDMSGVEISPIPADSFAYPGRLRESDGSVARERGGWPEARDLLPGSWTVLVKDSVVHAIEEDYSDEGPPPPRGVRAEILRYAFVRARVHITLEDLPATLGPEHLEVGGLKEFLHATAPEVDPGLVDKRLAETVEYIAYHSAEPVLPPNIERLAVFSHEEACKMAHEFLESAAKEIFKES